MTGPVAPTVAQPLLRPYRMGDFPLANRDRRRLEDETRSGTTRIAHRCVAQPVAVAELIGKRSPPNRPKEIGAWVLSGPPHGLPPHRDALRVRLVRRTTRPTHPTMNPLRTAPGLRASDRHSGPRGDHRSADLADHFDGSRQCGQSRVECAACGVEPDGRDTRVAPNAQPLPHHGFGANQRGCQHHFVGHQGGCAVTVTSLPALADLPGDVGPALTAVGLIVEIG